ncbi:hypothetical protein [Laspinema olomoucense]|uniref:hypothetical protein n=1 Tax=Laspinema olomoucense TaxID=3231600 RepID=UPI0021BBA394|nr:hypothetical protein [Laspinema sp. D3c]MCT7993467.1 hypothetical protein [Laspinema sp. D3c]
MLAPLNEEGGDRCQPQSDRNYPKVIITPVPKMTKNQRPMTNDQRPMTKNCIAVARPIVR